MANEGKTAENIANNVSNSTAQNVNSAASDMAQKNVSNNANKVPKHNATRNVEIDNESSDINRDDRSAKQIGKDIYSSYGPSARNDVDMTPEERKEFEKERAAKNTADVINASADVAASSNNGYAKAFGYIHKGLNDITGGKYGDAVGRVASKANKLAPFSQSIINKAAESGAAEKVGDALAAKSGDAKKAGEKAGEKAAEQAAEKGAEKAAEKAAEKGAEQAAKKAGEKAGEKTAQSVGSLSADDSGIKKFFTNPLVWVIGLVSFPIIILVLFVVFSDFVETQLKYGTGEFPYANMDYAEDIKVKMSDGSYRTVPMDDYVAGVLAHEVGCFQSSKDLLKAQAIAARTYAQIKMKQKGYIVNSTNEQTYDPDPKHIKPGSVFYQASYETAGVVLVTGSEGNYKFMTTEYDAMAVNESCGGKIDTANNRYIICQKGVEIPIDWTKKQGLQGSWLDVVIKYYHGRGMSQWGAYYLAKEKKYDFKQIIHLFYDKGTIVSLYPPPPAEGEGKISLKIKVTPSSASQLVHTSVKNFLSSKGTSIKKVNDNLRDEVIKAGPGTREGVATAAIYLINTFLEYDIRLPYQYGGGWAGNCSSDCRTNRFYGINPKWGTAVDSKSAKYNSLGMDCASFVTWAFHTGGLTYPSGPIKQFGYLSDEHVKYHNVKNTSEYIGQPGDFMHHPGHVMLIIGNYKKGSEIGYYIAEASGYKNDIQVRKVSVSSLSSDNKIGDMSYHYKHNKVKDYKKAFDEGRLD